VGSFTPNNLGIFDLGGNVWEWCSDRYEPAKAARVLRGGAWSGEAWSNFLASFRYDLAPDARSTDVGFRCVLAGAIAPQAASPASTATPTRSK
jgi:formylglycine-generating enzyme required for sulfatase activity